MRFFDLNIHVYPETSIRTDKICKLAKEVGYFGIAITNHSDFFLEVYASDANINVYKGVEIKADNISELHNLIKKYRSKVDVLAVHGSHKDINRAAVESPNVDFLAHPGRLNHVMARFASENEVAIGFNTSEIIKRDKRVKKLSDMKLNLKLARKYNAPMILTSCANSIYEFRAPREMIALARLFGMNKSQATYAISNTPAKILGL